MGYLGKECRRESSLTNCIRSAKSQEVYQIVTYLRCLEFLVPKLVVRPYQQRVRMMMTPAINQVIDNKVRSTWEKRCWMLTLERKIREGKPLCHHLQILRKDRDLRKSKQMLVLISIHYCQDSLYRRSAGTEAMTRVNRNGRSHLPDT